MSPAPRDVPAVLAQHGIASDADAPTLLAELAARGIDAGRGLTSAVFSLRFT